MNKTYETVHPEYNVKTRTQIRIPEVDKMTLQVSEQSQMKPLTQVGISGDRFGKDLITFTEKKSQINWASDNCYLHYPISGECLTAFGQMNTTSFMGAQPELTCPAGHNLVYDAAPPSNATCQGKCKAKIAGAYYGCKKCKYEKCALCVIKEKEDAFKDPVLVKGGFTPEKMVSAANYTAIMTEEGDLYEAGELAGKRLENFTKCLDFPQGSKVAFLAAATETCWVVLADNSVYYKGTSKQFHFPENE
jgi:hypothetical protein